MRFFHTVLFVASFLASSAVWSGASSVSDMESVVGSGSGGGRLIVKINRHAIKSAVLIRELLAQNGVPGVVSNK